jgi:hypothetical protein
MQGYYTAMAPTGTRVVVLNTAVCDIQNMHNFIDGGASARTQLSWLQSVLTGARAAREPCLITGHIPPGVYSGCWVGEPVYAFVCLCMPCIVAELAPECAHWR